MESNAIIAALAALAQETRLEVYRLLVQAGPEGLPAGAIGAKLALPLPTLSFHLAQLKHAGLVAARRRGRSIVYAAQYDAMNDLIAYLTENCCGGASCLPAPAKSSEGVPRRETLARARRR
jgi:ArsR family transcriptional regulator, arsenate/arsenite/antimonite-responsive transcriptional repressor